MLSRVISKATVPARLFSCARSATGTLGSHRTISPQSLSVLQETRRGMAAGMPGGGSMSYGSADNLKDAPLVRGMDTETDNRTPIVEQLNSTESDKNVELSAKPNRITDREYYVQLLAHPSVKMPGPVQDYYIRSYDLSPDVIAQAITLFRREVGDASIDDLPRHVISRVLSQIFERVASDVSLEAQKKQAEQSDEQLFMKEGKTSGFNLWYEETALTNPEVPNFIKEEIFLDLVENRGKDFAGPATREIKSTDWAYGVHPNEASEEQVAALREEVKLMMKEGKEDPVERELMEAMKKQRYSSGPTNTTAEKQWVSEFPDVKVR